MVSKVKIGEKRVCVRPSVFLWMLCSSFLHVTYSWVPTTSMDGRLGGQAVIIHLQRKRKRVRDLMMTYDPKPHDDDDLGAL